MADRGGEREKIKRVSQVNSLAWPAVRRPNIHQKAEMFSLYGHSVGRRGRAPSASQKMWLTTALETKFRLRLHRRDDHLSCIASGLRAQCRQSEKTH